MVDTTYYPHSKNHLSTGVLVSILAHIVFVLVFFLKSIFYTAPKIDYSTAMRVDLVALPDKLPAPPEEEKKQLPPKVVEPEPAPAPAPAPPPPKPAALPEKQKPVEEDAIKLQKETKKKQLSAIEKLKAMEALDKIKNEVKKEEQKKVAAPPIKGRVLSAGTSLTGLSKIQEQNYIGQLDTHIKANWTLPQWLNKKNYRTQIRVQFDEKGAILSRQIVRSSGNPTYDEMALTTIDKSAPFPAPPEKFTEIFKVDGVLIGFPE